MRVQNCYFCGSDQHSFYAEENGYSLVKCDLCGLLFVEDRPSHYEISQAHKQGKHGGTEEFDVTGFFNPKKIYHYLKVLDDLYEGDHGHIATWLDVGCGHGEFMVAVQNYSSGGISVRGTEPNVYKQESARRRGLDVGYFDIASHKEKYDAISLLNVYSHLPNPPEFLASLKELLNAHGELVLQTGDTANLSAKDHYRPFYLPDHLSFASERIVVGMLQDLNFEVLSVNKYPFKKFSLNDIVKEFIKSASPNYKSHIQHYLKKKIYSQTDMFIRAKKADF